MSNHKRPTQTDVARLAEVSQTTVSYVLNNSEAVSVSPATRQRIWDAIDELGYVPNQAARSLRTNRTFSIASIIEDITNPFYPAFERGIQDVAEQNGYDLIIYSTRGIVEKERKSLRSVQHNRVEGLIGIFSHLTIDDLRPLIQQNIAVVKAEAQHTDVGELALDTFFVDNVVAARTAVNHLIQRGHTRIGMIGGPSAAPRDTRIVGYRQALVQHHIPLEPSLFCDGDFSESSGYKGMQRLLLLEPRPTAVFAANDLMAIGALIAIKEAGLKIPEDVAVMGFDDIPTARLVSPPLTTIAHFPENLGRRAAELLFERLNGTAPPHGRCVEMPYELIVRESA